MNIKNIKIMINMIKVVIDVLNVKKEVIGLMNVVIMMMISTIILKMILMNKVMIIEKNKISHSFFIYLYIPDIFSFYFLL
jgi:hypothetical protein